MWRPKNWEELAEEECRRMAPWQEISGFKCGYEAGADAILEALCQTGYKVKAGESFGDERTGARTIVKVNGRIVFIEEEQNGKH